jgi:ubiquinone biosynthesis protein UbiJ
MENGKLERPPARSTIVRIADALDVSPGTLLKAAGYDQDPMAISTDEIAEVVDMLDVAEKTIDRLRERLESLGRQS